MYNTITVQAPVNIALIKYWGKRNEELILPFNDSISINIDELHAITRISVGSQVEEDKIIVNEKVLDQNHTARFKQVIKEFFKILSHERDVNLWHVQVNSTTNFPTAAGLASSAAGFAAIAFGLGKMFNLNKNDIIRLARIGSGSACRSILGGFVYWKAGTSDLNDSDCVCETLVPSNHWAELRSIIIVVNNKRKKVGSSEAMRNSVRTSELFKTRTENIVPQRVEILKNAIRAKNFAKLAKITMSESNQLHAICLDTNPPCIYLNETSYALMEFVHDFNTCYGTKLAYTFDAGPNCCMFLENSNFPLFESAFKRCFSFKCSFPQITTNSEEAGTPTSEQEHNDAVLTETAEMTNFSWTEQREIHVEKIIVSTVGMGPCVLV